MPSAAFSEDEDYTSIGAILRFDGKSFTHLIIEIPGRCCCAASIQTSMINLSKTDESLRTSAWLFHH